MRVGDRFNRRVREIQKAPWRIGVELAFSELNRLLHRDTIERLFNEFEALPDYDPRIAGLSEDEKQSLSYAFRAMEIVRRSNNRKKYLTASYQEMINRYSLLRGKEERDRVMLGFLSLLEKNPRRLRGDAKAFRRRWADLGLVTERCQRVLFREEMLQELCLDIVGHFLAAVLATRSELTEENVAFAETLLKRMDVERFLTEVMEGSRRWQTRVAAFETLAKIVNALPQGAQFRILSLETSALVMRFCTDPDENVWAQIAAIGLLARSDPLGVMEVIEQRLLAEEVPSKSDDLFVRRGIVEVIGREFPNEAGFEYLARLAQKRDPSDFVRVKLVETLATYPTPQARNLLREYLRGGLGETCPQVRAQAAFAWGHLGRNAVDAGDEALLAEAVEELSWAIAKGELPLLRRAALEEAAHLVRHRENVLEKGHLDAYDKQILDAIQFALDQLTPFAPDPQITWAADAWLQIVVVTTPEFPRVREVLLSRIEETDSGRFFDLPRDELPEDEETLGRILAYLTLQDFGLYVEWRGDSARIYRGYRMRFALWRALHELRNPSPAKRQGFRHTVGRQFRGTLRAHSGILAEVTQTKVPGEPLYLASEASWRRHLPLVDDYLSLCRRLHAGREVRLFSSFGVTTLQGPADALRRWRTFFRMSWNFPHYAELRNANPLHKQYTRPREYIEAVRRDFGIETRFTPHAYLYEGEKIPLRVPSVEEAFAKASR